MDEQSAHLSPDLQWMLQSDQVDDETLIASLTQRYYQRIYNLLLSRHKNPEEAHRIARETLVTAVLQKGEYRGESKVEEWLETIAARICEPPTSELIDNDFLKSHITQPFQKQYSSVNLSPQQIDIASQEIKSQIEKKRSTIIKRGIFHVLGISFFFLLIAYAFVTTNISLFDDQPLGFSSSPSQLDDPNALDDGAMLAARTIPTKDVAAGRSSNINSVSPLSTTSTENQIRDRMLNSNKLWKTLWAEIFVTFFGPSAYSGPALTERHQFFIDRQEGGLLVSGPKVGFPDYIEKIFIPPETPSSMRGVFGTFAYSNLGSQYPWFGINTETIYKFPFVMNYLYNQVEPVLRSGFNISTVDESEWAERPALIVDLTSQQGQLMARLWVDLQTGVILREQYFDPDQEGRVIVESSLSEINFNNSIPTMWKRPATSTPSSRPDILNSNEQPEIPSSKIAMPFPPAPSNYDPSGDQISFFKANSTNQGENGLSEYYIVANNLTLGSLPLYDPLHAICIRSPDGNRLAYSKWIFFSANKGTNVYWIDLLDLTPVDLPIPKTNVVRLSFSPDGQTLAVIGYDGIGWQEKFYLIDLETGDSELLDLPPGYMNIAWSPSGKQFAIMNWSIFPFGPQMQSTILVYEFNSRELIDEVMTDLFSPHTSDVKVSLDGWTAEFRLQIQDLTQCTKPPGGTNSESASH
jgi:hypothetical protein